MKINIIAYVDSTNKKSNDRLSSLNGWIKNINKKYKIGILQIFVVNNYDKYSEYKKDIETNNANILLLDQTSKFLIEDEMNININKKSDLIFIDLLQSSIDYELIKIKIENLLLKTKIPLRNFSLIMINEKDFFKSSHYETVELKGKRPYLVIYDDCNYGSWIVVPFTTGPLFNKDIIEEFKILNPNVLIQGIENNKMFIEFILKKYKNRWLNITVFKKNCFLKLDQPLLLTSNKKYDWKNIEYCKTLNSNEAKPIKDKIKELFVRFEKK